MKTYVDTWYYVHEVGNAEPIASLWLETIEDWLEDNGEENQGDEWTK